MFIPNKTAHNNPLIPSLQYVLNVKIPPPLTYTDGLIPVIVQDSATKTVLMFAYANEEAEAVALTETTRFAHYYSRSRSKLWKKGEESVHLQKVIEIRVDC